MPVPFYATKIVASKIELYIFKNKYTSNNYMTLYCFDVDGTLLTDEMQNEGQYVKGIIPTQKLIEIEENGDKVAIVSPSPFLPKRYANEYQWINKFGSNEYRWANVKKAIQINRTTIEDTVYVDDLEANRIQLENLGIKSYSPQEFMKFIDGL